MILRWYACGLGPNDVLNQMSVATATRATFIPDLQGSIIATLDSNSFEARARARALQDDGSWIGAVANLRLSYCCETPGYPDRGSSCARCCG